MHWHVPYCHKVELLDTPAVVLEPVLVEHKQRNPAAVVGEHRLEVRNTSDNPHQMTFVVLDCMVMSLLIHLEFLVVQEVDRPGVSV